MGFVLTLFEAYCASFAAFLPKITDLATDRWTAGHTDGLRNEYSSSLPGTTNLQHIFDSVWGLLSLFLCIFANGYGPTYGQKDLQTYGQTDRWIFPFFIRYREPPVHVRLCLSPVVPLSAFLLKITNLPTDRRTYGWTDRPSHRDARLHLKRLSKRVARKNTANWMMKNNLLHDFFSYCVPLPQKSGW